MTVEWSSNAPVDVEAPVMLVAFEGWNDAADVATNAVEHLELNWGSTPVASINGDEFYNYLEQRPAIRIAEGVPRGLEWPEVSVSVSKPEGLAQDVVLVRGPEPSLRWRRFAELFVDLADTLGVSQVVLLGAYLSDTPHTRPVPLTGIAFSKDRAAQMGVTEAEYSGPIGVTGVLQQHFTEVGIPTVSLSAAVPHYVAAPPNPKATEAVLRWLAESIGVPVPLEQMTGQAAQWVEKVNAAAAEDDDLSDYIQSLEERSDEAATAVGRDPEPDRATAADAEAMRMIDGDAIAEEFERYLRGDDSGL